MGGRDTRGAGEVIGEALELGALQGLDQLGAGPGGRAQTSAQGQQLGHGLKERVTAKELIPPQTTHHHLQSRLRRFRGHAIGVEAIAAGLIEGIKKRRQP